MVRFGGAAALAGRAGTVGSTASKNVGDCSGVGACRTAACGGSRACRFGWKFSPAGAAVYVLAMPPLTDLDNKLYADGGAIDRGHDAWFRAKVERALEQSRGQSVKVSIEKMLRDSSAWRV